jgi:hypothetical protein
MTRMQKPLAAVGLVALGLAAPLAFGLASGACADDHATVRDRPDGGADSGDGGVQYLACGIPIPTTYDGSAFTTNAQEELALAADFTNLDSRMAAAEGAGTSIVTTGELAALYTAGTPSLRSDSTSFAQAVVDGYLGQFGDAAAKTWTADEPESEAGAPTGGKYGAAEIVSPTGLALREATDKTLLGAALYNHALALATGPVTAATIDRLLALFGATPKFANSTDPSAGPDQDKLLAEYASKRDDKSQPSGAYRRIKLALLSAKAAAANVATCKSDLDAALAVFFTEWERVTYASAIYYLNDANAKALAVPQNGPIALQSLGEAQGFVQSFKGIAPDRRRITDGQIDDILGSIGNPYLLVAHTSDRVPKLVEAIQKIQNVYSFTAADVEGFERVF